MFAEESHYPLGRVGVVVEERPKPVEDEGQRYLEGSNCIFLKESYKGVYQSRKPLVSQIGIELAESRDYERHLFVDGVFGEKRVGLSELYEVLVIKR